MIPMAWILPPCLAAYFLGLIEAAGELWDDQAGDEDEEKSA